ncbi:hypothetical protein AB1Y20_008550 [Prymnesium parvum]|uniref:Uncharacterized protein n=1 Tax=Prymnesium parvum TaxID=97485 RepID=A0AB34IUU8_PRYPA
MKLMLHRAHINDVLASLRFVEALQSCRVRRLARAEGGIEIYHTLTHEEAELRYTWHSHKRHFDDVCFLNRYLHESSVPDARHITLTLQTVNCNAGPESFARDFVAAVNAKNAVRHSWLACFSPREVASMLI